MTSKLVPQIIDGELLVDRVRLNETKPPRRQRGSYGGGDDHDRVGG
jgi:hypothetical protein